jgi:arylamine N-acetyltransferase
MKNPDVHLISIVIIDGGEYIVDGGYAAPFLEPLPRELTEDYIINHGNEEYRVKSMDEKGRTKVEQYYNGELRHWYIAKPQPRKIEEFRKVIEDSYKDDAIFMNSIRISRFSNNGSLVLRNLLLTETVGLKSSTIEISRKDILEIIQEKFGISADIAAEATINLKELKDTWS